MTAIQIFQNPEFGDMRVTDQNGQEWYCSADVCRASGIDNSRDAVSRLDEDERITLEFPTVGNSDGRENTGNLRTKITFVSEAGLYALILTSNKPEAKAFKRWLTHVVIPSIRRTGGYGITPTLDYLTKRLDAVEAELFAARKIIDFHENSDDVFDFDYVAAASILPPC